MIALLWAVDPGGQLQPAFPGADVGDVPDELASGAGAVKSRSTWSAITASASLSRTVVPPGRVRRRRPRGRRGGRGRRARGGPPWSLERRSIRCGAIASTGAVRSRAWIWDFSSTHMPIFSFFASARLDQCVRPVDLAGGVSVATITFAASTRRGGPLRERSSNLARPRPRARRSRCSPPPRRPAARSGPAARARPSARTNAPGAAAPPRHHRQAPTAQQLTTRDTTSLRSVLLASRANERPRKQGGSMRGSSAGNRNEQGRRAPGNGPVGLPR